MNAVEIEEAISALAEQAFDPAEFPFAFLQAFGNKDTTIKRLRSGASNRSDLGGVLQTNNCAMEAVTRPAVANIANTTSNGFCGIQNITVRSARWHAGARHPRRRSDGLELLVRWFCENQLHGEDVMSDSVKPYAYADGSDFTSPNLTGPPSIERIHVRYGHRYARIELEGADVRSAQVPEAETVREELRLLAEAIRELLASAQGIISPPRDRI